MENLKTCIPLKERKNNISKCGPKEWEIKGRMGESSVFGEVYLACCKQKCDSVMKIQKIKNSKEEDATNLESEVQYLMAEKGLSPKISYSNICNGHSIIIMEALERTVWDFIQEVKDSEMASIILQKVLFLLDKIHSLGYIHGDSHLNNFMVRYDKKEYQKLVKNSNFKDLDFEVFAIDFGLTEKSSETRIDFEKLAIDLIKRYEDAEWTKSREEEFSQNIKLVLERIQN